MAPKRAQPLFLEEGPPWPGSADALAKDAIAAGDQRPWFRLKNLPAVLGPVESLEQSPSDDFHVFLASHDRHRADYCGNYGILDCDLNTCQDSIRLSHGMSPLLFQHCSAGERSARAFTSYGILE
jgi:hypothetical protein